MTRKNLATGLPLVAWFVTQYAVNLARNHQMLENSCIRACNVQDGCSELLPDDSNFEVTGWNTMNKNIVGIILIVLALLAVYFYGWPKIQPYLNTGGDVETMPADGMPGAPGEPGAPTPAPQP